MGWPSRDIQSSFDPPPPSNPGREPGVQKRRINPRMFASRSKAAGIGFGGFRRRIKRHLVCKHEELHKKQRNGFLYKVFWTISFFIAEALQDTRVTPNQLTVMAFVFYAAAGSCFFQGVLSWSCLGGALFILAKIVESTDGKLARLTGHVSNFGIWLKCHLDYLKYLFVYPPMAWAVFRQTSDARFLFWALLIVTITLIHTFALRRYHHFPFSAEVMGWVLSLRWHAFARQFYAHDLIEAVLIFVFANLGQLKYFLVFWAAYLLLYYLVVTVVLGKGILRREKSFLKD